MKTPAAIHAFIAGPCISGRCPCSVLPRDSVSSMASSKSGYSRSIYGPTHSERPTASGRANALRIIFVSNLPPLVSKFGENGTCEGTTKYSFKSVVDASSSSASIASRPPTTPISCKSVIMPLVPCVRAHFAKLRMDSPELSGWICPSRNPGVR